MFDYLFAIKFDLAVFLILFGVFLLVCAIAILITLWRADPGQLAEVRRLINLAKKANKGDMQARGQCNHEPDIKIRLTFINGQFGTHCEVSWSAIYRIFGYST